ncbi:unnamed protein product, partial [Citrullus colocynthis]
RLSLPCSCRPSPQIKPLHHSSAVFVGRSFSSTCESADIGSHCSCLSARGSHFIVVWESAVHLLVVSSSDLAAVNVVHRSAVGWIIVVHPSPP